MYAYSVFHDNGVHKASGATVNSVCGPLIRNSISLRLPALNLVLKQVSLTGILYLRDFNMRESI